MSRGHGELHRFILAALEQYMVLTMADLAIMYWPDDRHPHGNRAPYKSRVESMRRAANKLAEEHLVWWSWTVNWGYGRGPLHRSPVNYVPLYSDEQRCVSSTRNLPEGWKVMDLLGRAKPEPWRIVAAQRRAVKRGGADDALRPLAGRSARSDRTS